MSKVIDTQGKLARAKSHMPSQCSVRKSPLCDEILSLRLQGYSYKKIEVWLRSQGEGMMIPAATLCRNLQKAFQGDQDFMPAYEEVAEAHGGDIALDPGRTLAGQALIQRMRIDYMVRQENDRRKVKPGYSNPRIRQEMETYLQLVNAAAQYETEKAQEEGSISGGNSQMTPEAEAALAELIMSGKITMPGVTVGKPNLVVVGKAA